MNDQQFFLANAYLDGELTADERAVAESDPVVMAGVEELRALQADLRAVDPPTRTGRESAITAAMSVYAAEVANPAPADTSRRAPSSPRVVPFWRRPTPRRALAFAAAIVAVGLLGVIVVELGRGSDLDTLGTANDDAADTGRLTESVTDDDQADLAELAPAADAGAQAGDDAGDDAVDEGTDTAEDSLAVAGDDQADSSADDLGTGVVAVTEALGPTDDATLPTPGALSEFGAELLAQWRDGLLPPSPNTTCAFVDRRAEILSQTGFATEVGVTELLVAVDEVERIVYAIDPDTCEIVVDAPLE